MSSYPFPQKSKKTTRVRKSIKHLRILESKAKSDLEALRAIKKRQKEAREKRLKTVKKKRKPPTCSACGTVGHNRLSNDCPVKLKAIREQVELLKREAYAEKEDALIDDMFAEEAKRSAFLDALNNEEFPHEEGYDVWVEQQEYALSLQVNALQNAIAEFEMVDDYVSDDDSIAEFEMEDDK